jgi:hypothetical protein
MDVSNAFAVSVVNVGGNQYLLEGAQNTYNVGARTYYFSGIPQGHPMKVWQDDSAAGCTITMTSCQYPIATDWCWGDAAWSVSSGCAGQSLSLNCVYHGAMGGTDKLVFNAGCSP